MKTSDGPLRTGEALSRLRELTQERVYRPQVVEVSADLQTWRALAAFRQLIEGYQYQPGVHSVGTVLQIGDGIAIVSGLRDVMVDELLEFPGGIFGLALNLDRDHIGCVLLGPDEGVRAGDSVLSTGRVIEVPVGKALLGRVVNALGQPVDGKGPVKATRSRPLETEAPGVIDRVPVNEPLQTGIKVIDAVIPLGRGQRELLIGDRQIGKTAIAVDTVLNQKGTGVVCIYVCIGQKMSNVAHIVDVFERTGAMEYTTVVVASADESPASVYLAPYAGCAMAEEFMYGGRHALIVFDDLSKHAVAYRQLSLLLRRPPGREAYPGDIFYIHSRLLERAAKLKEELGGGTMTALPVVETKAGNIAAYIPTNLISITDGQTYFSSTLFNRDFKPAIDVGLSVSRVGGAAQNQAMRVVSRRLRLDIAQYLELETFARFGAELDASTRERLARGERLMEILKQPQYEPLPVEEETALIFAAGQGYLDDVPLEAVKEFEHRLLIFLRTRHARLLSRIAEGFWSREMAAELSEATVTAKRTAQEMGGPAIEDA
jgi:F-type H+-transporting ATPase subunit alpha